MYKIRQIVWQIQENPPGSDWWNIIRWSHFLSPRRGSHIFYGFYNHSNKNKNWAACISKKLRINDRFWLESSTVISVSISEGLAHSVTKKWLQRTMTHSIWSLSSNKSSRCCSLMVLETPWYIVVEKYVQNSTNSVATSRKSTRLVLMKHDQLSLFHVPYAGVLIYSMAFGPVKIKNKKSAACLRKS